MRDLCFCLSHWEAEILGSDCYETLTDLLMIDIGQLDQLHQIPQNELFANGTSSRTHLPLKEIRLCDFKDT